ncbi:hypothetical protein MCERE19_00389 [Spirosomataceae bacterium]
MLEFGKVFNENRILLSEELCSKLDDFGKSLSKIYSKTGIILDKYPSIGEQILAIKDEDSDFSKLRKEVNVLFDNELRQILNELEANFRLILGVI